MRESIKNFVSIFAKTIPILEPIYEFGSLQVPGQEGFANLRIIFPEKDYIGADMRKGLGVDKILNLLNINLPDNSVGTVICMDTLEHVEYPVKALKEIHRILKPDGIVLISSVMNYPIHNHPYDYWRFTPEAFNTILKPFKKSWVGFAGIEFFPHTVVGAGFKGKAPALSEFIKAYTEWKNMQTIQEKGKLHIRALKLLLPPYLFMFLVNISQFIKKILKVKKK